MSVLGFLTAYIIDIIGYIGYTGIFLLMTLESALMPVPSEAVMTFSGVAAQSGALNFWLVGLAGSLGCLTGSVIAYAVGYYGGRPLLARYGKFVLIDEQSLARAERWFAKHGEAAVFFTRLLPVMRTIISLPAGIARMDFKRFAVYSFAGSAPWCFALAYVGWALGKNAGVIEQCYGYLEAAVILGLAIFAVYAVYSIFVKKKAINGIKKA